MLFFLLSLKDSSPKVPHSNHTSHDTHPDNPPSRDNSHRIKSHFKPFSQNKLDQNTRSDINITKSQKFNPIPVFRPRNLTFNFAGSGGYPGRRKLTLGSKKLDSKIEPITHSTELDLLDFIDLFKSFSLRCRKDLKDVFERLSTTRPFVEKKSETNEYELDRPRREMGKKQSRILIAISKDICQIHFIKLFIVKMTFKLFSIFFCINGKIMVQNP